MVFSHGLFRALDDLHSYMLSLLEILLSLSSPKARIRKKK